MRALRRVGVALLLALATAAPVSAQSRTNRVTVNAAVGPSFAACAAWPSWIWVVASFGFSATIFLYADSAFRCAAW